MKYVLLVLGFLACALPGCVVEPYPVYRVREIPGGLTSEAIVRMSKAGTSDAVLLQKIADEGMAARPTAEEVETLKKEGLSDAVVAAMVSTRVVPPERHVEYVYDYYPRYYSYPYPYYYSPYGYGYYPYGHYPYYGGYYYGGYYGRYYRAHPHSVGVYRR